MNLPLRTFVPLVLLLFTALAAGLTAVIMVPIAEQRSEAFHIEHLRQQLQVVQGAVNTVLEQPDPSLHSVRLQLANLALSTETRRVLYVDLSDRVILDAARRVEGSSATAVLPTAFARLRAEVIAHRAVKVIKTFHQGDPVLLGAFPVVSGESANSLRPEAVGLFVVESSLIADNAEARRDTFAAIGIFTAVIAVLSVILGGVLHRRITARLQRMLGTARRIAAGDFSTVPVVNGRDEFGQLELALREMTVALGRQESSLRDSESRLRLSQEHAGLMTLEWHLERNEVLGTGHLWNALTGCALDAYGGAQALGYPDWLAHVHPDDRVGFDRALRDCLVDGRPVEVRCRVSLKDERARWMHWQGGADYSKRGEPYRVLLVGRDITAEQEAEVLFLASQREIEYQKYALDQHAIVAITDDRGVITYVNDKFCEVSQYERGAVIGKTHKVVNSGYHPRSFFQGLWQTIAAGRVWQGEIKNRRKDGSFYWVDTTIVPHPGPDGRPDGYVAIRTDVTLRKETELEKLRLQDQLIQAQKMETVGQLTGGIAHDFNNILASVLGYTELALELYAEQSPPKLVTFLGEVKKAGERAKTMIGQLLAFSRGGDPQSQSVALGPLLQEIVAMLKPTFPSSIRIDSTVAPQLPDVVLDPVQIQQVLMNLCINARDAMEGHGIIELRVGVATLDHRICASCRGPVHGRCVEVAVEDNGPGMPPHIQERIFEPFFTTKPMDKGTGMGLAMVHGIIHRHGGHLLVDSQPGLGTTFRIVLPCPEPNDQRCGQPEEPGAEPIDAGAVHGNVLVVDDEPALCEVVAEWLKRRGLTVRTETSSRAALDVFRGDPSAFDLVISDQTMPGLTGDGLATALLALRPDLPIIVMTGYSATLDEARAHDLGIAALVQKPLDRVELFAKVSELLLAREALADPAEAEGGMPVR